MNIAVCLKQVPASDAKLCFPTGGKEIEESSIEWIINPYDEFALESALQIKDHHPDCRIFVLSLGPKRVEKALRQALAMGADEAFHLESKTALDSFSTADVLAKALKPLNTDLILTGRLGIDKNQGLTGPLIAETLNLPHAGQVSRIEKKEGAFICRLLLKEDLKQEIYLKPPGLITMDKSSQEPRLPSLPGLLKAKKKPFHKQEVNTLKGLCSFHSYHPPKNKPTPKILEGSAEEQTEELIKILKEKIL